MPWLRVESTYFSHPKTLRLKELLGEAHADIYPIRLWGWIIIHALTGDLSKASNAALAAAAGFPGEPDKFVEAMYKAGFLDTQKDEASRKLNWTPRQPGEPLLAHAWSEYSGQWEILTKQGRHRMQQFRRRSKRSGNANVRVTSPLVTQPELELEVEKKDQDQNPLDRRVAENARVDRDRGRYPAHFQQFWTAYPRKIGKGAALASWKRLGPDAELVKTILAAVDAQRDWPQWTKDDGRFIPHPTTWINQRRWEDEPSEHRTWVPPENREEER